MQRIFYILSAVLLIASVIVLAVFSLPLGIDFKGGSLMELKFLPDSEGTINVLSRDAVATRLERLELGSITFQKSELDTLLLRFKTVNESTHQLILQDLRGISISPIQEQRFDSIGPVIGGETTRKSVKAIIFVLIMIVVYVAFAFRKITFPIKSWRYGVVALITLFHDVVITVGIFSVYLYFRGGEIGVPFIAALLTILGYSVNDTIVVFDRIRENLLRIGNSMSFSQIISKSVRESLTRSINTSLTTLFVLLSIFFFGGSTVQDFVLVLAIGVAVGTYSSLAIASPVLGSWVAWKNRKSKSLT